MEERVTFCRICEACCGMVASVDVDGRVVKLRADKENPFSQGYVCPKGPAYLVTHGRGGMPNFSDDLDDKQIAAILTYVRTSWGNAAPALDPAAVAAARGAASPPNGEAGLPFH